MEIIIDLYCEIFDTEAIVLAKFHHQMKFFNAEYSFGSSDIRTSMLKIVSKWVRKGIPIDPCLHTLIKELSASVIRLLSASLHTFFPRNKVAYERH